MEEKIKTTKNLRISIGIPCFSGLAPEFFSSFMSAWNVLNYHQIADIYHIKTKVDEYGKIADCEKIQISFGDENNNLKIFLHLIPRTQNHHARNIIIEQALEYDSDYLIMVDDDMVLNPDTFVHMINVMEDFLELDILGMLAFKRGEPYTPVGYIWQQGTLSVIDVNRDKKGLVECDAVGFGAVIIRGRLLEQMSPPWCLVDDLYRGSDIYLCHRARAEFGAKIAIDTTHEVGHIGAGKTVGSEDYYNYYKR